MVTVLYQVAMTRGTYALATIPTDSNIVWPYKIVANSEPHPQNTQHLELTRSASRRSPFPDAVGLVIDDVPYGRKTGWKMMVIGDW